MKGDSSDAEFVRSPPMAELTFTDRESELGKRSYKHYIDAFEFNFFALIGQ